MWERFSYYGMRLTCFVFNIVPAKGLVMEYEDAMALYGTYTMWVYFHLRGFLADRYLGYRLCCARCFGNDFGPRIDGSRNAFFLYIELGFLL
jgi:POT family proton-dependent oligopeptide transporter